MNISIRAKASAPVLHVRCNMHPGGGRVEIYAADDHLTARCIQCHRMQRIDVVQGMAPVAKGVAC